jgi:hypothetical protein
LPISNLSLKNSGNKYQPSAYFYIQGRKEIDYYFSQLKELDRLDSIAYYQQLVQVKGTIEYEDVHISKNPYLE